MKKTIVRRSSPNGGDPIKDPHACATYQELLEQLFAARGEQCQPGDDYQLSKLHAPALMKGIPEAVALLYKALTGREHIMIVGDFDADGATSTALLHRCLRSFGVAKVSYLVPNRFEYGYGLTPEIVALAAQQAPQLIITVDNGISSIDGVKAAQDAGIKVLVTDHHLPGRDLPAADAIVNPNQPECTFPSKNLAGVGVIYYVMLALRAHLREQGWFAERQITEPNMAQYLDLVALGTVADVVPLDKNNRVLVAQGIQRIRARACCPGLLALLKIANRPFEKLTASDFGFAVGPRLNAAGRLDDMAVGIQCLLSDDYFEALEIATNLDALNQERRSIEASMQADAAKALSKLDSAGLEALNGVSLYQDDWHQGVVGILASRIKDSLHRPTIAFASAGDGQIKGSGRSIQGVHLRDVLDEIASANPGLLNKFGGHAMAAGLSLHEQHLQQFSAEFDEVVGRHMTEDMRQPLVLSDGKLRAEQLSLELASAIESAGPWGQMFPEPVFDGEFRIVEQRIVGAKHLKLMLSPGEFSDVLIDAIAFNIDLDEWPNNTARMAKVAYKLDINEFRGRVSTQLMIEYIEAC